VSDHSGFVPEPWGKVPRYQPTWVELTVSAGLWALGAFVFTVLAKAALQQVSTSAS
jgi:molybdopterin-containing oxidoreductase family membrane subunit